MPPGPLLLAEVEGAVEAAIGLEGGETVANPFSESDAAVSLLHRPRRAAARGLAGAYTRSS